MKKLLLAFVLGALTTAALISAIVGLVLMFRMFPVPTFLSVVLIVGGLIGVGIYHDSQPS